MFPCWSMQLEIKYSKAEYYCPLTGFFRCCFCKLLLVIMMYLWPAQIAEIGGEFVEPKCRNLSLAVGCRLSLEK